MIQNSQSLNLRDKTHTQNTQQPYTDSDFPMNFYLLNFVGASIFQGRRRNLNPNSPDFIIFQS